jgi:hypothetical protein
MVESPKTLNTGIKNTSIEKINKGITESITKGSKEIQLIQAYQQQKWKDQAT